MQNKIGFSLFVLGATIFGVLGLSTISQVLVAQARAQRMNDALVLIQEGAALGITSLTLQGENRDLCFNSPDVVPVTTYNQQTFKGPLTTTLTRCYIRVSLESLK